MIVALPSDTDYVRKISSEKEPHLTLLYLGDPGYDAGQIEHIAEYVEHAASQLSAFGLDVVNRGTLGDKNADVLFFSKQWSPEITAFRGNLLQDPLISAAYNSIEQFPGWTPHLTMGYPETPAKNDPREHPDFHYVRFDKIALWTSDSSGPTFTLKPYDFLEVAMSQIKSASSVRTSELQHYGVKGMKWGVRKSESSGGSPAPVRRQPPSMEALSTAITAAKVGSPGGGIHTLSNQELQNAITRMNLENQYRNLTISPTPARQSELDRGLAATNKILKVGKTIEDVRKFLDTPTGSVIKTGVTGAVAAAAGFATGGASAAATAGAGAVIRRVVA